MIRLFNHKAAKLLAPFFAIFFSAAVLTACGDDSSSTNPTPSSNGAPGTPIVDTITPDNATQTLPVSWHTNGAGGVYWLLKNGEDTLYKSAVTLTNSITSGNANVQVAPGVYNLTVSLCNSFGQCSSSAAQQVHVGTPPTPPTSPGKPILAPITETSPGVLAIKWSIPDGEQGGGTSWDLLNNGQTLNQYSQFDNPPVNGAVQSASANVSVSNGTYQLSVRVCAADNACSTSDSQTITVNNNAEVIWLKTDANKPFPSWTDISQNGYYKVNLTTLNLVQTIGANGKPVTGDTYTFTVSGSPEFSVSSDSRGHQILSYATQDAFWITGVTLTATSSKEGVTSVPQTFYMWIAPPPVFVASGPDGTIALPGLDPEQAQGYAVNLAPYLAFTPKTGNPEYPNTIEFKIVDNPNNANWLHVVDNHVVVKQGATVPSSGSGTIMVQAIDNLPNAYPPLSPLSNSVPQTFTVPIVGVSRVPGANIPGTGYTDNAGLYKVNLNDQNLFTTTDSNGPVTGDTYSFALTTDDFGQNSSFDIVSDQVLQYKGPFPYGVVCIQLLATSQDTQTHYVSGPTDFCFILTSPPVWGQSNLPGATSGVYDQKYNVNISQAPYMTHLPPTDNTGGGGTQRATVKYEQVGGDSWLELFVDYTTDPTHPVAFIREKPDVDIPTEGSGQITVKVTATNNGNPSQVDTATQTFTVPIMGVYRVPGATIPGTGYTSNTGLYEVNLNDLNLFATTGPNGPIPDDTYTFALTKKGNQDSSFKIVGSGTDVLQYQSSFPYGLVCIGLSATSNTDPSYVYVPPDLPNPNNFCIELTSPPVWSNTTLPSVAGGNHDANYKVNISEVPTYALYFPPVDNGNQGSYGSATVTYERIDASSDKWLILDVDTSDPAHPVPNVKEASDQTIPTSGQGQITIKVTAVNNAFPAQVDVVTQTFTVPIGSTLAAGRVVGYMPTAPSGDLTLPLPKDYKDSGYTHVNVSSGLFSTASPGTIEPTYDQDKFASAKDPNDSSGSWGEYFKNIQDTGVKVMLSIGGAGTKQESDPNTTVAFDQGVPDQTTADSTVKSIEDQITKFKDSNQFVFDGVDFDIAQGLTVPNGQTFAQAITSDNNDNDIGRLAYIINKLHADNPKLLITLTSQIAALNYDKRYQSSYDLSAALIMKTHEALNWVNVKLYDSNDLSYVFNSDPDASNKASLVDTTTNLYTDPAVNLAMSVVETWSTAHGANPYVGYLRPDQVVLGYLAQGNGGEIDGIGPAANIPMIENTVLCLKGLYQYCSIDSDTNVTDTFKGLNKPYTIGGVMGWSVIQDKANGYYFARSLQTCVKSLDEASCPNAKANP